VARAPASALRPPLPRVARAPASALRLPLPRVARAPASALRPPLPRVARAPASALRLPLRNARLPPSPRPVIRTPQASAVAPAQRAVVRHEAWRSPSVVSWTALPSPWLWASWKPAFSRPASCWPYLVAGSQTSRPCVAHRPYYPLAHQFMQPCGPPGASIPVPRCSSGIPRRRHRHHCHARAVAAIPGSRHPSTALDGKMPRPTLERLSRSQRADPAVGAPSPSPGADCPRSPAG
jgi:hypothetical protein